MGVIKKLLLCVMAMIIVMVLSIDTYCADLSSEYKCFDFEDNPTADAKGWLPRISSSADAKAELKQGGYMLEVDNPGKSDGDVQIVFSGMEVKAADYCVKIWAKSTEKTYCHIIARNEESVGWDTFGGVYNVKIEKEISPLTMNFKCTKEGKCELLFNCGKISPNPDNPEDTSPEKYTILIDKIEIYEKAGTVIKKLFSFAPIGKGSIHEGDEKYPFMTFNGTDEDNERGVGTIWQENGSLFYRIDQGGITDWHNKLVLGYGSAPLSLEADGSYIITVNAKATKEIAGGVYLNAIGSWNPLISDRIDLSTKEQTFTYETSTPLDEDSNVELLFQFGSSDTAKQGEVTIEFTDIKIYKVSRNNSNNMEELEKQETSFKYKYFFLPEKDGNEQPYVGDPMVLYEDGVYYLYYLKDGGDSYNHSIYLATTKDFLSYTEYENPIIEASRNGEQDSWIGTGSVVQVKDKYYFFYTGHTADESFEYKEKIMLAVGDDPIHFEKQEGWEIIPPSQIGQKRDFRDPQVYYDKTTDQLYMMVTASMDGVARILKYTISSDLSNVNYEGILFTEPTGKFWNLECSDSFKIGDKWYLTYSAQDDTLWYAVSNERFGNYSQPVRLDGKLFYAAKHVSDGVNHYMVGWGRRSLSYYSTKEVSAWAGNMMVQQLTQNPDGTLRLKLLDIIRKSFCNEEKLLIDTDKCRLIDISGCKYQKAFTAYDCFLFTGKFVYSDEGDFGFAFDFGESSNQYKLITISPQNGNIRLSFDGNMNEITQTDVDLEKGKEYTFTYFQEGSLGTFYLDGYAALTVRLYGVMGKPIYLFSDNNDVQFTCLHEFTVDDTYNPSIIKNDSEDMKKDSKDATTEKITIKETAAEISVVVTGVGVISADGKVLTDEMGVKYIISGKLKRSQLKKNLKIADKNTGGKYKITKITKKNGKVSGGTVTYMAPYNKNCKKATAGATVKLAGVTFKITAINANAFKNCKTLTTFTMGSNVTSIGAKAFAGCKNLKIFTIKGKNLKKIGANAFKGINIKAKFKVTKTVYKDTKVVKKYTKMIKKAGFKKVKITK